MFVIDLHYEVSLESIDAHMKAHMTFLQTHYKNGTFIASGRKVPRTGGIILAMGTSKKELERIMAGDPFVREKLAQVKITEFQTSQVHPRLKGILK